MTIGIGIGRLVAGAVLVAAIGGGAAMVGHRRASVPASAYTPPPAIAPKAAPRPAAAPAPTPAPTPAAYTVKRILPIDGPLRYGDIHWDDRGVPAGEVVVTVDLAARVLSVFRAGYEIGATAIIYGADDKPTPLGVFNVTQKDAHHVSNLYDAPMPYMLRLTNDGISIHGSDMIGYDWVTHGCVGVPVAFARRLFGVVGLGTRVIVTRGERLQLDQPIAAA